MTRKTDRTNQLPTFRESCLDLFPSNAKIAIAAKPMGIDPSPTTHRDHLVSLCRHI